MEYLSGEERVLRNRAWGNHRSNLSAHSAMAFLLLVGDGSIANLSLENLPVGLGWGRLRRGWERKPGQKIKKVIRARHKARLTSASVPLTMDRERSKADPRTSEPWLKKTCLGYRCGGNDVHLTDHFLIELLQPSLPSFCRLLDFRRSPSRAD